MKNRNFISAVTASLLLVGCGGGGSSSSDTAINGVSSTTGTGYYVDAAVSGVNYQCGDESGVTDTLGAFTFQKNENCTFKLGDLVLREINASSLEDNVTIFENNKDVAQLLQTLDSDNNASNGIHILAEVHEVLKEQNILEVPTNDAVLLEIKDAVKEKNSDEYNGELVSDLEVEEHLAETLQALEEEGKRTQNDVEADNQEETASLTQPEIPSQGGNTGEIEVPTEPETENEDRNEGDMETPMEGGNSGNLIDPEMPNIGGNVLVPTQPETPTVIPLFSNSSPVNADRATAQNEVLIHFKEGMLNSSEFKTKLEQYLSKDRHRFAEFSAIQAGHISSDEKTSQELEDILKQPEFSDYVESVSKNYQIKLTATNDSSYEQLWAIENNAQSVNGTTGTADADMDVVEAWEKTTGSKEVIVAVLDTGVDYTHSDLADNMWQGNVNHGYDFAADNSGGNDDNPMPDLPYADNGHFHGTHVAGTIGAVANNSNGIAGVAQNVSIMALKVFRPDGTGYTSDVLEALNYVSQKVDEGENIVAINASFAGTGGEQTDTVNQVIKELGAKGVIFCAAAGNEASNNDALPVFPANYDADNIISIAATDANDNLASFSNYGATSVDVAAPGTNILSTMPDNSYAYLQGTSMATPNVAGSIALLASYYPSSTVAERKAMILNNVDVKTALNSKVVTNGRVNVNEALGTTVTPPVSNVAPIANDDAYITPYMTAKELNILSNDSDVDGDELSIVSFEQASNGTVTQENNVLMYTPNDGFSGEDIFTYTISDSELNATARVTMTVNEEEQTNTVPIANDDMVTTAYETSVTFNVLENDSDEQNDTLSITAFTNTLNGTVSLEANSFTYVPNSAFSGEDSFEYTLSDGLDSSVAKVQIVVLENQENNNSNGENNETNLEVPNNGDHNGTRPEIPNMGDFNGTRPEIPNDNVNDANETETPDSDVNENKFSTLLSVPALAPYDMVEGYKVYNLQISESTTEFFEGIQTKTYGINSNILGQTIRMHRGDDVKLVYTNNLAMTTTMHGHGMHLPATMDGVLNPIAPNSSWTAQYTVDQKASTNWYHPHYAHKTAEHVYMGLAGLIIIDDDESDALDLPKTYGVDDIPLILQDKRFDEDGQIDYSPTTMEVRQGYKSDIMLVNGAITPHVDVPAKQIRFRVLNASNARVYKLAFTDGRSFKQIATDNSFLESPVALNELVLSPAERAEILVDFNTDLNNSVVLKDMNANLELMQVNVNSVANNHNQLPTILTTHVKFDPANAVRTRKFALGMSRGDDGQMHMSINGKVMDMARIDEVVPVNDIEIWEITNMMGMEHNFHLHSTHFYPLERDGSSDNILANEKGYKDTIRMAPRSTVKFIVKMTDFPDDNNAYMYHCHFLEHEDDGMMGQFTITNGEAKVNVDGISSGMGRNNGRGRP